MKEIQSLEGKKAIRRLTPAEVAYYQREHGDKVEIVPGKGIHAVKAPDGLSSGGVWKLPQGSWMGPRRSLRSSSTLCKGC